MAVPAAHADLAPFAAPGGMFDTPACELDANVGRFGRLVNPNAPGNGTVHHERFEVVGVQKNWRGELCYRVVPTSDVHRFGYVANPADVIFEA